MSEKRMKSLRKIAMAIFTEEAKKSGLAGNKYVKIKGKYLDWNQFFKKFKKEYKEGVPEDEKKESKKSPKKKRETKSEEKPEKTDQE